MKSYFLKAGSDKILLILFLLLISFSVSFPQESTKTYDVTNRNLIQKYLYPDGQCSFFDGFPFDYGVYIGSSTEAKTIRRSICEFPINFPAGAYVTNVEFIYKNDVSYASNFRLYYIPDIGSSLKYADLWAMTEASGVTELDFFVGTSARTVEMSITKLRDFVNNAIESGKTKIYLGLRAANENESTTASSFEKLQLRYTYEIGTKYTIKNSNGIGKIDLSINNGPFSEVPGDTVIRKKIGTVIKLRAKEEQFDGTHYWVWNQDPNTVQSTKSYWSKDNKLNIITFGNIEVQDAANENEFYVTYTAQLWKKYVINRVDKTEFDGNFQTNDLTRVVEGNSLNIPYSETLTKTTGTYDFAGWEDGEGSLRTPTDNATYTALYKIPNKSNASTAFSSSSQRKFIRTPDGSLHMVYESMGYVWYERSSNEGASWEMMNDGKPISGSGGKSPSIDYADLNGYGYIGIVFQEGSDIRYCSVEYSKNESSTIFYPLSYPENPIFNDLSEGEAMPVIAFGKIPYGEFLVVWKDNRNNYDGQEDGFYGAYCSHDGNYIYYMNYIEGINSGTKSLHPCLVSNKLDNNTFHLAWEDNISDVAGQKSGSISYARLSVSQGVPQGIICNKYNANISNGSGLIKNSMPSMIVGSDNNNGVRLAWIGDNNQGQWSDVFRGMFSDGTWNPRFWKFGSRVISQSLNLGSDGYFLTFSEFYYYNVCQNRFTDSRTLSNIYTLNTTGRNVQLNNDAGGTSRKMFVMSFNNTAGSLPLSFTKSNSIGSYYGLYKENSTQTSGRSIVLRSDSLSEFYFSLQDMSIDEKPVKFMDVSDTLRITDVNGLNKYMTTEPFTLTDNSKFLFNLNYGVTESSAALKALGKDGSISYTLDLIDAEGRVLQSFNKINLSKDQFIKNKQSSFQVNPKGIGNKTVRMRLRTEVNLDAECFLVDSHSVPDESGTMYKAAEIEKIDYSGEKVVKEYAISRNYPNPFNPSTVIDYQVPKTSKVTLKIFDMLGQEVATLVNEVKETGRYEVEFNASSLPSGTYIYEIRANDFVKSGKMMLLK
ncbi:MAG: T9SS type A sorting domain-containing protein [Ignavibacteria bacterium]|jgi:hypothetical protein|nr:T9SS type A sorting domain-containing protein [Ignavibacteria bacterium]MCU7520988.1 T9SS type A sorting domain-containing protein [Ignavibacteria bacterium]HEX2926365.1 T9SS type A sorting domain-containing protein [Ruminiclostridium sp.]